MITTARLVGSLTVAFLGLWLCSPVLASATSLTFEPVPLCAYDAPYRSLGQTLTLATGFVTSTAEGGATTDRIMEHAGHRSTSRLRRRMIFEICSRQGSLFFGLHGQAHRNSVLVQLRDGEIRC